ncbi:acyl-CoA thioesterase [Mesobacillus maritimus]|uniref:acyl-CoA thioesterase n=1 Tax=Mesobacillus maritimus TaxID=1643336 RepID=UPI00203CE62A|nr:thioesterase family protein [Mesobacillus maritimus]MCM3670178.1 acyl-CoA thioesterase [Mesobacillus maritimus]
MEHDFRFSHKLKVRYSEIDGQKIVFNAHYLTYLDIAIAEYFVEGLQLDLLTLAEDGTFDFVVAKSTLEYKNSARLNDWLNIWCRTKKMGNTSMTMEFMITREGETEPLILAEIIYVSINPITHEKQAVPSLVKQRIESFEKGCLYKR